MIAAQGLPVQVGCRVLDVSQSGYYAWRSRRIHAELALGRGISVGFHAVELLMRRAGLKGVTGRPKFRRGLRPEIVVENLDADKRPLAATADFDELFHVLSVAIREDPSTTVQLLFDADHSLEERIIAEQFLS